MDEEARAEIAALRARVEELERRLDIVQGWRPPPILPRPEPPPVTWSPPPTASPPLAPLPVAQPAKPKATMESLLGARFAPRIGAVLVFIATLFFLGVAVQRGWLGPVAQLLLAVVVAFGLVGIGAWLTRKQGYGTYPQILEGLAAMMLYVTAFVSHSLPYYRAETGFTAATSGVMMALVAAGTVGLALRRDSRVIVSLGYGLGFVTAALGWNVLPALTLPYVAVLGTSLALLVAWKGWRAEAVVGTLLTGTAFFALAFRSAYLRADPEPWIVFVAALVPAAAFYWLSLRHDERSDPWLRGAGDRDAIAFLTHAWAFGVAHAMFALDLRAIGFLAIAWCAGGLALAAFAARQHAESTLGHGGAAFLLYLAWPPLVWWTHPDRAFATIAAYATGALALAVSSRAFDRGRNALWAAGAALAVIATFLAIGPPGALWPAPKGSLADARAWMVFALSLAALALLGPLAAREIPIERRRLAFVVGAAVAAIWAFALFGVGPLGTIYLVALAGGLTAIALGRVQRADEVAALAALLAMGALALAAVKVGFYDVQLARPRLPAQLAVIDAALSAAALITLHHLRVVRTTGRDDPRVVSAILLGGSAAVIASLVLGYVEGAWASVLLGAMGVAYLAAGFVMKAEAVYRYVGFGLLAFVLVRVFVVDLGEADLIVRAGVFAALGAILLGVGYVYARMNRQAPPS